MNVQTANRPHRRRTDKASVAAPPRPAKQRTHQPTARQAGSSAPAPRRDEAVIGTEAADGLDRLYNAALGRLTLGMSPPAMAKTYMDWLMHLAASPGKQLQLTEKAVRKSFRFVEYAARCATDPEAPRCIEPLPQDRRFAHEGWQRFPFNLMHQGFLLSQQWWHNATTGVRGLSDHSEEAVEFGARQWLDMVAPSNFPWLNPEILQTTAEQAGANLVRGYANFVEDWKRAIHREKPVGTEAFQVGRDVGITPGKVVFRNRLMELIQYTPTTPTVQREPVLMLSAWMMKYYIMDLSPHDSLVKYLVDRGHTVFMISWMNPGPEDRDLCMEDYRIQGVMAALDAVCSIVPNEKVHAVGYCLGGILLTITAAAMARDGDDRLASITLFTTMTDFTEVGEMAVFMSPSQLAYLEDMMWRQGYLDGHQASGGFQLLRSKDLIWSKMVREYFLGERQPMFDLMAWNADTTRMPYRQHAELMTKLYRDNQLFQGRYEVEGRPIALSDIKVPIFSVATTRDHVAPWRSVYKLHLQSDAPELTFVLTSGGHNVGIVNEPGTPRRSYQIATYHEGEPIRDPETWQAETPRQDGSWWPAWRQWLVERSAGEVPARAAGAPERGYESLCDAPGTYVLQQ